MTVYVFLEVIKQLCELNLNLIKLCFNSVDDYRCLVSYKPRLVLCGPSAGQTALKDLLYACTAGQCLVVTQLLDIYTDMQAASTLSSQTHSGW